MELPDFTFCIPHKSTCHAHTQLLKTSIQSIRRYYTNRILVCKTSTSLPIVLNDVSNVDVYTTFIDDSHVFGAIELLVRECKTNNFILMHDSMFLLRALPENVGEVDVAPFWHFDFCKDGQLCKTYLADSNLSDAQKLNLIETFNSGFPTKWRGFFGPGFLGKMQVLQRLWHIMNITPDTAPKYLGREGLMATERYIPLLLTSIITHNIQSLCGSIQLHPNAFVSKSLSSVEEMYKEYDGYFYKYWVRR